MYKAVGQAVFLYGGKIWVATDKTMTVLEGFHHRIAKQISGMTARKGDGREREWDSVDAKLEVTGLWLKREFTRRRKAKIIDYIAGRPIYKHCKGAKRMED